LTIKSIDTQKDSCQYPDKQNSTDVLKKGLDFNSSAAGGSSGPTWGDLIRAERTAGVPAVSGGVRQEIGGGVTPLPVLPQTNSVPSPCQTRTTRIVGFIKLRSLLRPVHKYFKDKIAEIVQFRIYEDKENDLVYPEVKAWHRNNPYRRHQLTHRTAARTYKRMRHLVGQLKLSDDFKVASLTLTMPKYVSEYMAASGKGGRGMAWRLFDGFWNEDLPGVIGQDIELGSYTNLHLWRTQVPVEPHFHFHSLIPNYGLVRNDKVLDDNGEPSFEFKKWQWSRQRGGREVPFSDSQLEKLKELWKARLVRFCRRHSLRVIESKVDIYVSYIDVWAKLIHRLNYNGRHWSENYAEYSNANPDCPDPPEWLENYENKARVKGFWSNLKNMALMPEEEKVKESPYTGEAMRYMYPVGYEGLINYSSGNLGAVEFIRGEAKEGFLDDEQKAWLKGVMKRSVYDWEDGDEDESLDLDTS